MSDDVRRRTAKRLRLAARSDDVRKEALLRASSWDENALMSARVLGAVTVDAAELQDATDLVAMDYLADLIDPTCEATPVPGRYQRYKCSACGFVTPWYATNRYCPHCGARVIRDISTD